jgi:hypothetical protein
MTDFNEQIRRQARPDATESPQGVRDSHGRFAGSMNDAIRSEVGVPTAAEVQEAEHQRDRDQGVQDEWEAAEARRAAPLVAAAEALGFRDPDDAPTMIPGTPADPEQAVRALAAAKPHLLESGSRVPGLVPSWDGGPRRTIPAGTDFNQLIRQAVEDVTGL